MRKLGRKLAHRKSMLRNLVTSLLLYEEINTTVEKSKDVKALTDRLIARSAKADLAARRAAISYLFDKAAVHKLFSEIIPRYKGRNTGYVRILKTGKRLGDNASMAHLELVDKKKFVEDMTSETSKENTEKPKKVLKEKSNAKS